MKGLLHSTEIQIVQDRIGVSIIVLGVFLTQSAQEKLFINGAYWRTCSEVGLRRERVFFNAAAKSVTPTSMFMITLDKIVTTSIRESPSSAQVL